MSIATVEYPGYGVNTEVLTHDNIFETCESFIHYFQTGKYEGVPIIVYIISFLFKLDMVIH